MKKMSLWEFFALIDGYTEANKSEEDNKQMTEVEKADLADSVLNYDYSKQD